MSIWDRIFPTSAHRRELTPEEEIRAAAQREMDERAAAGASDAPVEVSDGQRALLDRMFGGGAGASIPGGMAGGAVPQALTAPRAQPVATPVQPMPASVNVPTQRSTTQVPAPTPVQAAATAPPQELGQPTPVVDPASFAPKDDTGIIGRMFGYGDQTPDPRTGLAPADRAQMGFNSLGQLGAMLMAAGQPITPGQRAGIYAQMGNIGANAQNNAEQIGNNRAWRLAQVQRTQALLDKANAKSGSGGGGPFAGTGMDQQAHNIVLTRDPNSPEYAAAYTYLSKPKEQFDATSGKMVVTRPDMSWARPPGGGSGRAGGTSSEEVPGMGGRFNQDQGNAAIYADRLHQSEPLINQFATAGMETYQKAIAAGGSVASNYLNSNEYKRFDQAQRNWINATLRRESGAVISPEEFNNARIQYMPQPGDSPELLAQKAANRATVGTGMGRAAGPSYKPPETTPAQTTRQVVGKTSDGRTVYVGADGQRYVE